MLLFIEIYLHILHTFHTIEKQIFLKRCERSLIEIIPIISGRVNNC